MEGVDESPEALEAQAEADDAAERAEQLRALGWQPNPDGTWYPATPEAIVRAQAQQQGLSSSDGWNSTSGGVFGGKARRAAEAQSALPDPSQMVSVDAYEAAASAPDNPVSVRKTQGSTALAAGRKKGQLSALVGLAREKNAEDTQIAQNNPFSGRR